MIHHLYLIRTINLLNTILVSHNIPELIGHLLIPETILWWVYTSFEFEFFEFGLILWWYVSGIIVRIHIRMRRHIHIPISSHLLTLVPFNNTIIMTVSLQGAIHRVFDLQRNQMFLFIYMIYLWWPLRSLLGTRLIYLFNVVKLLLLALNYLLLGALVIPLINPQFTRTLNQRILIISRR